MGEMATLFAMLADPIRWVLFGSIGASAALSTWKTWPVAGVVAIVCSLFLPQLNDAIRLTPPQIGNSKASYNPLDTIRGTKYEENHLDAFIAAGNEDQTRALMRLIDQAESECRTLVGGQDFDLWARCRQQSRIISLVSGALLTAAGFGIAIILRRRW